MPLPRHYAPALPLLLAAISLAPVAESAKDTGSSSLITDAKGLSFSGYEHTGAGRRRWTLTANTATPADTAGKRWNISKLSLSTFDSMGKTGVSITAPNATFNQEERSASDPGEISLIGERVRLTGKNWAWKALENHDNRIEVGETVRVTLTPQTTGKDSGKPVRIEAGRLIATTSAQGMALTFHGNVRVRSGDVLMETDELTTIARTKGVIDPTNATAVEKITASGHVRISRGGSVITGESAIVTPSTGVYEISGDTKFTDLSDHRIVVSGSSMRYDGNLHRVVVEPGADGRVHAELPELDAAQQGKTRNPDARALASAEKLSVEIRPDRHRLTLEGDVCVDDTDNRLRCGRLAVETLRVETEFARTTVPGKGLSLVLAEKAVEYTRDRRLLRCERAEILPQRHKAILTGNPRAEDTEHQAALEAHAMTLDTGSQSLRAESGPDRRVRVTLSALRQGETIPYTMESDLMMASRRPEGAVFEFEDHVTLAGKDLSGTCDRLGIEVENRSAEAPSGRVRRIVAAGSVKLTQSAYTAEAARAEIIPGAALREIIVKEDNGLDGKSPFFVTLESDLPAGVRTRVTLPAPAIPGLTPSGPIAVVHSEKPTDGVLTLTADFQELVAGRDRIRTFSRGAVVLTSPDLNGKCDSLELRAISAPTETAEKDPSKPAAFTPEALIARGSVNMTIGERTASANTLEIMPADRSISLIGNPMMSGWPTPPGIARKNIKWQPFTGPDGKAATRIRLADEPAAGMPEQIIRPRLLLPTEMSVDLGRSLRKNLDNKAP